MCVHASRGSIVDMIEVRELIKDYRGKRVVNRLSFTARPGVVTGFLGPKGSGKSTTMRIILGLDAPTSGTALVNGQHHTALERPTHTVGALLDTSTISGDRSAIDHLRLLARSNGISQRRVVETLEEVGLSAMADKRIGGMSLGMRQRLRIAGALLGNPGVLLFDEPMRDLAPEDIQEICDLMRSLATADRTVLVSGDRISEMALTADQMLILHRGELITEASTWTLTRCLRQDVFVRSPRRGGLTRVLTRMGATVRAENGGGLSVMGMEAWRIASAAAAHYIPIQELTPRSTSLEDFYQELINIGATTYAP
jgi:ABC-2 type transport system ATP-binding protein